MGETIQLAVNAQLFNFIINALSEKPYKEVADVINNLQQQVIAQLQREAVQNGPITSDPGS